MHQGNVTKSLAVGSRRVYVGASPKCRIQEAVADKGQISISTDWDSSLFLGFVISYNTIPICLFNLWLCSFA